MPKHHMSSGRALQRSESSVLGLHCIPTPNILQGSGAHKRRRSHAQAPGAACSALKELQQGAYLAGILEPTCVSSTTNSPIVLAAASSDTMYQMTDNINSLIQQQLSGVSPATYAIIFAAGLLTSLSPCTLSVLPLTLGYIGGYASEGGQSSTTGTLTKAISFSLGLATTLAVLGVFSSLLGRTYGQIGSGLPIAVALVAIAMGLNLLEVLPLRLPSLDLDVRSVAAPAPLQAYLVGLTFALAASPCSTPVLATLLAYVSTSQDPLLGGSLLLAYTIGYVGPLLLAATAAGSLKQLLSLRQYSAWITPASGVLLLSGGTYTLLSRLL